MTGIKNGCKDLRELWHKKRPSGVDLKLHIKRYKSGSEVAVARLV